jgi:uroporphyrin-III C-methyltransferase / precorrin-2 dehydrogenase / sirohydrochlorin ferrochelatase
VTEPLLPLFVKLSGRAVLLVGGGAMAAVRARQLAECGARVKVVAPEIRDDVAAHAAEAHRRPFEPGDLDGAWYAVAAATSEVNRAVAEAAEARRILVNAVDDPDHATVYSAGVIRRGGATVAVSTEGKAPALAGLLREALEGLLPEDLGAWVEAAEAARAEWKRARVPMATRRPLLLERLNALYARVEPVEPRAAGGFVSLVGAGPGDPELLTRRAAERLARADVVLYDALVDPAALRLAPRAHRFLVGKRAGRPSVSQRAIERLLVGAARRGQRVVRLKCGDPFVLGRGGEEALALAAAGVPFEVVPGVSSALAAPALAGIPVTHRGLAAGFAVVSGHSEASYGPLLDALKPAALTLVVLMGVGERARLATRPPARGWPAATPAALVSAASTSAQRAWSGTLGELAALALPPEVVALPGTLVVGAVAAFAAELDRARPSPPLAPRQAQGER